MIPGQQGSARRCRRCDFGGDLADLREHATETGHQLCVVCQRTSLHVSEQQTCPGCVTKVKRELADIPDLYALLPALLTGWPSDTGYDHTRGSGEDPLPGGDALVLAGPGSDGRAQVRAMIQGLDASHAEDEFDIDPPSVLAVLASWEDDWRRTFGHGGAEGQATVTGCAEYLGQRMEWAAQNHQAFDEFADDVRKLHGRLAEAASVSARPLIAPVACFDCGGRLQRAYKDETGLVDDWQCAVCRRAYSPQQYVLALRAALEGSPDVLLDAAGVRARWPQVSGARLRKWAERGLIKRRGVSEGRTLYRGGDVADLLDETMPELMRETKGAV